MERLGSRRRSEARGEDRGKGLRGKVRIGSAGQGPRTGNPGSGALWTGWARVMARRPLARGGHEIGKGQRRARSCAVVTGNVRTGTRSGEFRSRQAALG